MVQVGKVLEANIPNPKLKLMALVREVIRLKHYSIRTEEAEVQWLEPFILFHPVCPVIGEGHPL